ncbi:MAG: hypothetical protein HY644_05935 [Acidobacteria bacterium]|nr:hypothetical protein [Acidobacteriota bacterium]
MSRTSRSLATLFAVIFAGFLLAIILWMSFSPAHAVAHAAARVVQRQDERNSPQAAANARGGFWRPAGLDSPNGAASGLNPAQIKTIHDKLQQISDVFREVAVLKSPVGFEAKAFHTVGSDPGIGKKNSMPASSVAIYLFDYDQTCPTCPIEPVVESRCHVHLWINNVHLLYHSWQTPFEKDNEGPIYVAPRRIGEFAGFPVYDAGSGPYALLTNDITRPVWLPVSRERYIRAKIATWQNHLLKLKPPNDKQGRADIAELEAELDRMSPAERASPAYVGGKSASRSTWLSPADDQGAQALVATNPAFFDLTRPRTSFQMAILNTYPKNLLSPGRPNGFIWRKLLDAFKEVDWKRVAGLLQ